MIPASKGGSEHKNGGFWRVEISDQGIDGLKFEARVDEDIVFAFGFAGFGPELEGAGDGSADGDDAVAGSFGGFDSLKGFFGDMEPFGMHVVLFDIVGADGQKSTEADMERKILNLDAFVLEFLQEGFGHIETGGWSSSRAELFGPDSLIAFDVVSIGVAV